MVGQKFKLLGSGSALPGDGVTTTALLDSLSSHCSDSIVRRARILAHRLGIEHRYLSRDLQQPHGVLREDGTAPILCSAALRKAFAESSRSIEDTAYLIGHTATPHTALPPNIAWVAETLKLNAPYMELRQACTGFANALKIGGAMITANNSPYIAIVGSETGSAFFNANDQFADTEQLVNYVQMGDGAGAVVIGPDDGTERSIISDLFFGHIGNGLAPGLALDGGGSTAPYCAEGRPIFTHHATAVRESGPQLFEAGIELIQASGYALSDFAAIVPHQANGRMAQPLARHLGISPAKIHVTADRFGNLGSAAIWVAFDDLLHSGKLNRGDKVLILGAEATKFMYGGFVYTH